MKCVGTLDEHRLVGHGFDPGELFGLTQLPGGVPVEIGSFVLGHREDQIEHSRVRRVQDPLPPIGIGYVLEVVVQSSCCEDLVRRIEPGEDGDRSHEVGDVRDLVVGEGVARGLGGVAGLVAFAELVVVTACGESDSRLDYGRVQSAPSG